MPIDVSICMVSLNCWPVLKACLESLETHRPSLSYEVILVDNDSSDGTPDLLREHFPRVRVVRNERNVGFTVATNQTIRLSSGRYLLWLNTDTVLRPRSLDDLYQFLELNPKVGIAGPKVLNSDGTFQRQCKRGSPTPFASALYLLRADRLLPKSRLANQYLLRDSSPDSAQPVASVSGCCLMARREVWNQIGPLDERIFGFGEDIDWCLRAARAGWEVWYYPKSVIVHLKGQGGAHSKPYHKLWGMHQAMWVVYRKHFSSARIPLGSACVAAGILVSFVCHVVRVAIERTYSRRFGFK